MHVSISVEIFYATKLAHHHASFQFNNDDNNDTFVNHGYCCSTKNLERLTNSNLQGIERPNFPLESALAG